MELAAAQGLDPGRPTRLNLFGVSIELAQPAEMLGTILAWDRDVGPHRVMYVNAYVLNHARELPELERALGHADLVYCEGDGVRLAARVLDLPVPHCMTSAEWVWGLAALCESGARSLYLLGSEPPLAQRAATKLLRSYPRLRIVGTHHGYAELDSPQNQRAIEDINATRPDIVLVGMGTPKQELWADRYANQLDVDVVWTVGGLFDYLVGRGPRIPLGTWRRSLIGNWVLVSRVLGGARRRRGAPGRA